MGDLSDLLLQSLESAGVSASRLIAADSLFARPFSIMRTLYAADTINAAQEIDEVNNNTSVDDKTPLDLLTASRLAVDFYNELFIKKEIKQKAIANNKTNEIKQIKYDEEEIYDVMDIWNKPYGWFFLEGEKIPLVK